MGRHYKEGMFEFNLKGQEEVWRVVKWERKNTPGRWASRSEDRDTENKWLGGEQITLWLGCRGGNNRWDSWKGTTERTTAAIGVSGQWRAAPMNIGESICVQTWSGKIKSWHEKSKLHSHYKSRSKRSSGTDLR